MSRRIIQIGSLGCDVTDMEHDEVLDHETVQRALIRYIQAVGPDYIEEGDTIKVINDER
ncbi:MAG TPA: hypothetical protein VD794_12920 [Flavisolibacter sp.]|nr:hypothetical protein [Flavisolibacter sp.]